MTRFSPKESTLIKVVMNILQKRPWEFGVVLEDGGWLSLKILQKVLKEEGVSGPNAKGLARFFEVYRPEGLELKDGRIRALPQGHHAQSQELYPPDTLYLGVRDRAIEAIRSHGLDARKGGTIVLATTPQMAQRIISRKTSKFTIIEVNARAAQARGLRFESLGGPLFSCPYLLPQWMNLPEKREEEEAGKGKVATGANAQIKKVQKDHTLDLPGSFYPGLDPTEVQYLEQKARGRRRQLDRRHKKGKRRK